MFLILAFDQLQAVPLICKYSKDIGKFIYILLFMILHHRFAEMVVGAKSEVHH